MERPAAPWSKPVEEVLRQLASDPRSGLGDGEVAARRERFGPNRLRAAKRRSRREILWDQVKSIIVLLLLAAIVVSLFFAQWVEAGAIGVVIVINTLVGFLTELRAVRSMEALRELGQADSKVRREAEERTIVADGLVPGDIEVLEQGEVIGADLRLVEVDGLRIDESALTGESVPVAKQVEPVAEAAGVGDRACMGFRGTAVTRGWGIGVVVGTGMSTEIGGISALVEEAQSEQTPLERRLAVLGRRLVWLTLVIAAAVAVSGVIVGRDVFLMLETGIALAVAAIPEGLPIVSTLALARGVFQMAKRNALVRRLSSVQTLGSTTVICADKTGTLTENRMRVAALDVPSGRFDVERDAAGGTRLRRGGLDAELDETLKAAIRVAVLANDVSGLAEEALDEEAAARAADPMELALLRFGRDVGFPRSELVARMPEVRREPFEHETTMMASFHRTDGKALVAVKGAPEAVIPASVRVAADDRTEPLDEAGRRAWRERSEAMARQGLRVLGLASKEADPEAEPYTELVLDGLVGLIDPPREGVAEAVRDCRRAGVRVVMVTGDHPETARQIASRIGLGDAGTLRVVTGSELRTAKGAQPEHLASANVFARVDPEQKLALVDAYQELGEILAMTGDGVNDAPALKSADIGIAMGRRGTEVAREAADMVLLDDAFPTIVTAIRYGRIIFRNVRVFVIYLLSGNVGEVLAVGAASIAGTTLPLLPLQILYLNLVNDVFPALALGLGQGEERVMERPPRDPRESILERAHWIRIGLYGVVIGGAILGAFFYALGVMRLEAEAAITTAFLVLSLGRLLHAFNMRDPRAGILRNHVTRNPFIWGALAICLGLLAIAVYLRPLAEILELVPPAGAQWLVIAVGALVPLLAGQLYLARIAASKHPEGGRRASV